MPVAFHPPVEPSIQPPQATRGSDDPANGELFAALLANAGKASINGVGEAGGVDKSPRKDTDDPGKFDPLDAFAAWTGAQPGVVRADTRVAPAPQGDHRNGDDTPRKDATIGGDAFAAWAGAPVTLAAPVAMVSAVTPGERGSTAADTGAVRTPPHGVVGIDTSTADVHAPGAETGVARTPRRGVVGVDAATPDARAAGADAGAVGATTQHDGKTHHVDLHAASTRRALAAASRDTGAAPATSDATTSAEHGSSIPGTAPGAPFAATVAAAMLAKSPDTKLVMGVDAGGGASDRSDATDAAPGVNLGANAPASAAAALVRQVADPVGSPGFATQVAGELAQLVHLGADRAQLHVHPTDMGPIDVTMRIQHGQVHVTMAAADPQTRAALEQSLPQLRDLLANQGLALANASVNDQAPRDDHPQHSRGGVAPASRVAGIDAATPLSTSTSIALRRLVDLYA
jgi:flagellar hook-length control protein FliK